MEGSGKGPAGRSLQSNHKQELPEQFMLKGVPSQLPLFSLPCWDSMVLGPYKEGLITPTKQVMRADSGFRHRFPEEALHCIQTAPVRQGVQCDLIIRQKEKQKVFICRWKEF